jgi:hypothetical protein
MRIIIVLTCSECPFLAYSGYTPVCHHKNHYDIPVKLHSQTLHNCPLDTPQTAGFVEASAQQPTPQGMPETQDIKD